MTKQTQTRKKARKPAQARSRKRAAAKQISTSNLALHELFQQQAAAILEQADISEEEKQSILIAMSCPCCGAAAMSFSVRLKRDIAQPAPRFAADGGEDS